jgi:hypothetical protein
LASIVGGAFGIILVNGRQGMMYVKVETGTSGAPRAINDAYCQGCKEKETRINQLEKTIEIDSRQLAAFANDWDKIAEILNDDNKGPTCKLQKIREVVK